MFTLIIPAMGASSRFPEMRPKWMLTHPDGKTMLAHACGSLSQMADRTIFVTRSDLAGQYPVEELVSDSLPTKNLQLLLLDAMTSGPAETVAKAIEFGDCSGPIVVRDTDSEISGFDSSRLGENGVGYFDLELGDVTRIGAKSFIKLEHDVVRDIDEKRVVSGYVSIGLYSFKDSDEFMLSFQRLEKKSDDGEIFVSHVIKEMLFSKLFDPFLGIPISQFKDYGTIQEWRLEQQRHVTFFVDFDGVLVRNTGQYGDINWDSEFEPIIENLATLREYATNGAQVIITTSRKQKYKARIYEFLRSNGISPSEVICECHHAPRYLINDFAPSNKYPSAIAINLPRNGNLKSYI